MTKSFFCFGNFFILPQKLNRIPIQIQLLQMPDHCYSKGNKSEPYPDFDLYTTDAVEIMKELGFREVYNMEGGIVGWEKANYPIVK